MIFLQNIDNLLKQHVNVVLAHWNLFQKSSMSLAGFQVFTPHQLKDFDFKKASES